MKKATLIVLGSLLGLMGLGALFFGGLGLVVVGADGEVRTDTHHIASSGRAIVSRRTEILGTVGDATGGTARLRIDATTTNGKELFLGVGPADEVEAWLQGTPLTEVDVRQLAPFGAILRSFDGGASPADPTQQTFWEVQSTGTTVSLDWPADDGPHRVVLMNLDRSERVAVNGRIGVFVPHAIAIGVGCVVLGLGLAGLGVLLFVRGMRIPGKASRGVTPSGLPPGSPLPPPQPS